MNCASCGKGRPRVIGWFADNDLGVETVYCSVACARKYGERRGAERERELFRVAVSENLSVKKALQLWKAYLAKKESFESAGSLSSKIRSEVSASRKQSPVSGKNLARVKTEQSSVRAAGGSPATPFYACGHERGIVIMDSSPFGLAAYFEWAENRGYDGDKSLCWFCWTKQEEKGVRR